MSSRPIQNARATNGNGVSNQPKAPSICTVRNRSRVSTWPSMCMKGSVNGVFRVGCTGLPNLFHAALMTVSTTMIAAPMRAARCWANARSLPRPATSAMPTRANASHSGDSGRISRRKLAATMSRRHNAPVPSPPGSAVASARPDAHTPMPATISTLFGFTVDDRKTTMGVIAANRPSTGSLLSRKPASDAYADASSPAQMSAEATRIRYTAVPLVENSVGQPVMR